MFLVSPFCNRCFHFNIQIHFALSSLPNSIHRECKFFFPYETFSNQRYSRRIYANKINGRKLSRLFDYDLKSIYVYCYRVNFLSLDIRYFHRTVKNIYIYIFQYDNGTCLPKIAFPKQGSRGAPSSTEGNYSHVARVIGRIFNRCRELIFSVAQSITCP